MATSNTNYSRPEGNKYRNNKDYKTYKTRNNSFKQNELDNYNEDSYLDSDLETKIDNSVLYEKLETQKRLERKKQIKKRKDEFVDSTNNRKSAPKSRRKNNINWKRGYEEGLFNDDEFYDEYMR